MLSCMAKLVLVTEAVHTVAGNRVSADQWSKSVGAKHQTCVRKGMLWAGLCWALGPVSYLLVGMH